jgi:hypothetical protein
MKDKNNKKKAAANKKQLADEAKVVVENVNVPNYQTRVDRKKYEAMRRALMKTLPKRPPGKSQKEMFEGVKAFLPEELFPGGAKSGWWVKTVQLDLEAKKVIKRTTESKPTRWYRL